MWISLLLHLSLSFQTHVEQAETDVLLPPPSERGIDGKVEPAADDKGTFGLIIIIIIIIIIINNNIKVIKDVSEE